MAKRLNDEELAEAVRLYQSGVEIPEVAQVFGVSRSQIYRRFQQAQVALRPSPGQTISSTDLNHAAELVRLGRSVRSVAQELELPRSQLDRRLRELGVPIRTQSEATRIRNRQNGRRRQAAEASADWVIQQFVEGDDPLAEIASQIGSDASAVRAILLESGFTTEDIRRRRGQRTGRLQMAEEREGFDATAVAGDYVDGLTLAETATKYDVSVPTVVRILAERSVKPRQRKWEARDSAFRQLTPEGAYWLGFIEADGNLSRSERLLTLRLSDRDRTHLLRFASWLELPPEAVSTRVTRSGFTECLLSVTSGEIGSDLRRYGIVPGKSKEWSGGFAVPEELLPDFIRGWFDGDGMAAWKEKPRTVHNGCVGRVMVCGLTESIIWLAEELGRWVPADQIRLRRPGGRPDHYLELNITRKDGIARFAEVIDGSPRLERKWSKLDFHLSQWRRHGMARWSRTAEIAAILRESSESGAL